LSKIVANIEELQKKINSIDDEISNKMVQFDSVIEKLIKPSSHSTIAVTINDIEFSIKQEAKTKAVYKVLSNLANFIEN
jgi:hypothetical protein